VTTTDAICNCGENAERQVRMFSQRVQWTPLLLVALTFACENTHSVALGLDILIHSSIYMHFYMALFLVHICKIESGLSKLQ